MNTLSPCAPPTNLAILLTYLTYVLVPYHHIIRLSGLLCIKIAKAGQFLKDTYLPPPQVDQSNNLALSLQNRLTQWINTPADTEQSRAPDDGDQHVTKRSSRDRDKLIVHINMSTQLRNMYIQMLML